MGLCVGGGAVCGCRGFNELFVGGWVSGWVSVVVAMLLCVRVCARMRRLVAVCVGGWVGLSVPLASGESFERGGRVVVVHGQEGAAVARCHRHIQIWGRTTGTLRKLQRRGEVYPRE